MNNINFKKAKNSILNKLFLKIEYMSGDADAYEYEEVEIEDVDFTNYEDNLDKIEKIVNDYKIVGKLTDVNDKLYVGDEKNEYDYVLKNYSEEIAILYDNVPGDSTVDRQFKAHLSDIKIHAYNDKGELFISYT
jgi:hypothetical protein